MARRSNVSQATIIRTLKAAQRVGLKIKCVEVDGNKIVVHSGDGAQAEPTSELEAWKARRNAR